MTATAAEPATRPLAHGLVLDALRRGPLTSLEIARLVCGRTPPDRAGAPLPQAVDGRVAEHEGFVFATLLELRRDGLVAADWIDVGDERRKVHRLPDDYSTVVGLRTSATPPSKAFRVVADQMTKSLAFAPVMRGETRAEILNHLADSAASLVEEGATESEAQTEAVRRLGDPWKCDIDLGRAAQGKRTALIPVKIGEYFAALTIYDLRVLLVILAAIVFVRVQVVTAYHIPTKSMEPTLHGDPRTGDRILVDKLSGTPKRFDITVFDGWGEDRKNYVKRCVGLPGEKITLREGDVYVDDQLVRKDGDAFEGLLFEVFDRGRERRRIESASKDALLAEEAFRKRMQECWKFEGEGECGVQQDESSPFAGFRVSAHGGDAVPNPAPRLTWHEGVEDSYVDPETGESHMGVYSVADMRLTVSVKPVPDTDARVDLVLTRDDHRAVAEVRGPGKGVALFDGDVEVARDADVSLPDGVATIVSFSQVDHVLRLTVNGKLVLRHDLPAPQFPKKTGPAGEPMIEVPHGAAWIDPQRLERDVYYVSDGPEENFVRLKSDQFFMMGDNSSNSSDSRQHGPVHKSRLVGTPLLVVWPPSRIHMPK